MPNAEDEDLQNERVGALEGFAEASVGSIKTLTDRLQLTEARLQALSGLCEKLVDRLTARGALQKSDVGSELAELLKLNTRARR
jgi:hypothetical protein